LKSRYVEFPRGVKQRVRRDSGFLTAKREIYYQGVGISCNEYEVSLYLFNGGELETPDRQELQLPPSSRVLWRLAQTLMDVSDEIEIEQERGALPKQTEANPRKRLVYLDERGGDKEWYYLAKNTETDDIFVLHEWSRRIEGNKFDNGSEELDLGAILRNDDELQERIRYLIGSII
jgi:hypothetical protein